jgi:hypothetical protein
MNFTYLEPAPAAPTPRASLLETRRPSNNLRRAATYDESGAFFEARRLFGAAGRIARAVGMRACAGELAAIDN